MNLRKSLGFLGLVTSLAAWSGVHTPAQGQTEHPAIVNWIRPAQGLTAEFEPLSTYRSWWHEMEICANVTGDINSWHFISVAADAFSPWDAPGTLVIGATMPKASKPPFKRIYLIQADLEKKESVQHEMLHAILWDAGQPWGHKQPSAQALFDKCLPNGYRADLGQVAT